MRPALLIMKRELAAYLKTPIGYLIAAGVLFVGGLFYNGFALQEAAMVSSDVLRRFFYYWSGMVMIASVLFTMRVFAEERSTGTLVLLQTAPISERDIVLGKFLAAFVMLVGLSVLSVYLPLLILVNGKVSLGQLMAGYLGVLALGATTTAMGTFGSSLTRNQVLAVVLSAIFVVGFLVLWWVADKSDPPLSQVLHYLAMWDKHFYPTFTKGIVRLADLVFFGCLTALFLTLSTKVLAARRWVG